ncbi:type II toxin-antitoxin system VapC family toxin [Pseudidiomarina atlantica]|nr:PIN domain nuclease [Pseudidiomarina atlantica]
MVDSSVWIDYFIGKVNSATNKLDALLGEQEVVIGDLILTEILQGFRSDKDYETAKRLLENVTTFELIGREQALTSAENYRTLRKKGVTVRKTADVIIASFCLSHNLPLLFTDRDFLPFVEHLGLRDASLSE